ncbi:SDR family oxidoreductase [Rhizorhabdus sp.]|uniref:SDR family oxidoreductase n=1 Tax=Rhizorhabdus sp. TaxID=1968843 RepID=UPI0025CDD950|nr:SDR family oxidoreductase [Rhizorhabdus sp.]
MIASAPRLASRRALVTGGLGGLGVAIARLFVREGADVWLTDVHLPDEPHVRQACEAIGSFRYLQLDVSREEDWRAAAIALPDRLDILVNNAGIAPTGEMTNLDADEWQRVMAVNAMGAFLGLKHMTPLLAHAARDDRHWSAVVNMSSILADAGLGQTAAYASSKGALKSLSRAAAIELAPQRIRVNALHPGFARTAMTAGGSEEMAEGSDLLAQLAAETPMGRIAEPEEIANAVLFLASDESSFMTGSTLTVDGGWTAR